MANLALQITDIKYLGVQISLSFTLSYQIRFNKPKEIVKTCQVKISNCSYVKFFKITLGSAHFCAENQILDILFQLSVPKENNRIDPFDPLTLGIAIVRRC